MKTILSVAALLATVTASSAQYGYGTQPSYGSGLNGTGSNPNTTQSGTYVGGHYQTNPNNTQLDNYGTRGNLNPYTGVYGTRSPRY